MPTPRHSGSLCALAKQARWSLGLIVVLVTFGVIAAQAGASHLRLVAPTVTSFHTDGVRYAAWQENPAAPIVVLDTLGGSEREITTPGCVLGGSGNESGEGGMFLLSCFKEPGDGCFEARFESLFRCGEKPLTEEPTQTEVEAHEAHGAQVLRLLDVRTGVSTTLPDDEWGGVGSLYLESRVPAGECSPQTPYCVAFYDIATGIVTHQLRRYVEPTARFERADLNRAGAPPEGVCDALHRTVLTWLKYLSPRGDSAYEKGVFAHVTHNYRNVRVERCNGHSTLLPGPSEPEPPLVTNRTEQRSSEPSSFDLGDGLLTWDTGQDAGNYPDEESGSRGTLSSYQLASGRRRTWKLPQLATRDLSEGPGSSGSESLTGVYGYSTHTANRVFWIATRTLYAVGTLGSIEVDASSVYAAPLN
jgi:hypothetical protein